MIEAAKLGCAAIMLGHSSFTLVDEDDYEDLNQFFWLKNSNGYVVRKVYLGNGRQADERMHRRVMMAPQNMEVDHRFRNRLDNRKSELRICTHIQNSGNARKRIKSKSQYRGVYWEPSGRKWIANGVENYIRVLLGRFVLEADAARAYDRWAYARWGEFAHLNFPDLLLRGEFQP